MMGDRLRLLLNADRVRKAFYSEYINHIDAKPTLVLDDSYLLCFSTEADLITTREQLLRVYLRRYGRTFGTQFQPSASVLSYDVSCWLFKMARASIVRDSL